VGKLDIVRAGNPVLRARAADVDVAELGQKPLVSLVKTMVEAMRRAPGVGLAAPQLGVSKRVIVLEDAERLMAKLSKEQRAERERVVFPLRVIVNPVLTVVREEPRVFFEGCLSVPGWSALVPRAVEVEVRGTTEHGEPIEWRVSGWPARILQHEIDHLEGTLYVDRMVSRTFGHNDEIGQLTSAQPIDAIRERFGA
jgi:peptide deformylase